MWRMAAVFLVGGVLGAVFGVAIGFFIYPFVFPPPPAMEELTSQEQSNVIATGTFIHANPSDPIHWGKGTVSVHQDLVYLESDFEVGPGPAFHVYLVPTREVRSSDDLAGTMFVDLGGLRAFKGSQKYRLPAGVDLKNYPSLVIWCEQFSVLISPADLRFQE
jgi:Electron transfer DM13